VHYNKNRARMNTSTESCTKCPWTNAVARWVCSASTKLAFNLSPSYHVVMLLPTGTPPSSYSLHPCLHSLFSP